MARSDEDMEAFKDRHLRHHQCSMCYTYNWCMPPHSRDHTLLPGNSTRPLRMVHKRKLQPEKEGTIKCLGHKRRLCLLAGEDMFDCQRPFSPLREELHKDKDFLAHGYSQSGICNGLS